MIFAKGASYAIRELSRSSYDVIGLDWTVPVRDARYKGLCMRCLLVRDYLQVTVRHRKEEIGIAWIMFNMCPCISLSVFALDYKRPTAFCKATLIPVDCTPTRYCVMQYIHDRIRHLHICRNSAWEQLRKINQIRLAGLTLGIGSYKCTTFDLIKNLGLGSVRCRCRKKIPSCGLGWFEWFGWVSLFLFGHFVGVTINVKIALRNTLFQREPSLNPIFHLWRI